MANVKFYALTKEKFETLTPDAGSFYLVTTDSGKDLYIGSQKLNNTVDISNAIDNLDTTEDVTIATNAEGVVTLKGTIKEENGIISAGTTEIVLGKIATSSAAEDVTVADSGNNYDITGTKTVEAVLAEIASMIGGAGEDAVVKMIKLSGDDQTDPTKNVAEYYFYQGLANPSTASESEKAAALIGTVEIAKDMVATSGELVIATPENPVPAGEGGADVTSGTFIKMTIANGTPFYIDVAGLIEYNTFTNKEPNNAEGIIEEIYVTDSNHTITLSVGEIIGTKVIYQAATEDVAKETMTAAVTRVSNAADAAQADVDALEELVGTGYGTKEVDGKTVNKTVKEYIDDSISDALEWQEIE